MNDSVSYTEMKSLFERLRMVDIIDQYEDLTKQATQEQWEYEKYLSEVLKIEESGRTKRRVERYERLSGLPSFKRFDSFNQKELAPDIQMKIKTLQRGDFINRYENILLFGQPGTGKTHLASAFGHELIRQGKKVYFSLCSTLVQELLRAKETFSLPRKLKQLSRYDLIIIDEIGYIQQSRDEMEVLFTLLADRYERGSFIVTSNLPFSKWEQVFKNKMLAAAAIDRLVHHSIILKLDVENYRLKSLKTNKKQKK